MSKRKGHMERLGGGVVGTLDAFLTWAESVLTHEIEIMERRLSLDSLIAQKRSSLGGLSLEVDPPIFVQSTPDTVIVTSLSSPTNHSPGCRIATQGQAASFHLENSNTEPPVKKRRGGGAPKQNTLKGTCLKKIIGKGDLDSGLPTSTRSKDTITQTNLATDHD